MKPEKKIIQMIPSETESRPTYTGTTVEVKYFTVLCEDRFGNLQIKLMAATTTGF